MHDDSLEDYQPFLKEIEYPDAEIAPEWGGDGAPAPPPTVRRFQDLEPWPLSLDEAIQLALDNAEVIRRLGGQVVAAPGSMATVYDPAIQETDPRSGPEAALAAFDARFNALLHSNRVEQRANSSFRIGDVEFFDVHQGDTLNDFVLGITKTAATGTQFSVGHATRNTQTNAQNVRFTETWDTGFEASFRHPLLQGSGIQFNRIAGPNAPPGSYRGILIARINSDVTLADFETAVRDLLHDVELAYWALYFTYREFDAQVTGREFALESWQREKRRVDVGTRDPDQEAFAREQYYLAQAAVENALSGNERTPGILYVEGQLRMLLGLPASDGRLIRPSTDPVRVDVQFDWQESLDHALVRRVELRRQRWNVKRRELELIAARNFGRMRLDFVGQYNFHGWGDDLFGPWREERPTAFGDLVQGNLQGWTMGFELTTPIGNRIGHAAIRNAELWLRREQALLKQQELGISYELREAFTELDRAYAVTRSNYNRFVAARFHLEEERKRNAKGATRLELVLDAQERAVESEVLFHRAVTDYNLALIEMQFVRGTLLDSLGVYLTEGPWSEEAHALAQREARRYRHLCYATRRVVPAHVSAGAYQQRVEEVPVPEIREPEDPVPLPEIPPEPDPEVGRLPPPT